MAAAGGSIRATTPTEEQWSALPADLVIRVYARLASPVDRVRFAAVCAWWRAVASTHPPRPVLPWLMLDPRDGDEAKRMYCPEDGTALPRVPLLGDAAGRCFIGGYDGGWVASSEAPLGIVNLFSGAELELSKKQRRILRVRQCTGEGQLVLQKVVFSEAPTSSGCMLAAITDKLGIAICKVGCPERGWIKRKLGGNERLVDIAFYNGELYGVLGYGDRLVKFEISMDGQGAPVRIDVHWLNMENRHSYMNAAEACPKYIVELNGKLVRIRWWQWTNYNNNRPFCEVDELVDLNTDTAMHTYDYKWVSMASLGDYALFLGPTCSKAVRVPADGRGALKRNHIYYSHHRCLWREDEIPDGAKLFLASSDSNEDRVYYSREGRADNADNMEGIMAVAYYARSGVHPPMWLLPPDM